MRKKLAILAVAISFVVVATLFAVNTLSRGAQAGEPVAHSGHCDVDGEQFNDVIVGDEGSLATFTDSETAEAFDFLLCAETDSSGGGDVTAHLEGPGLSLCTVHGDSADLGSAPGGFAPGFQCGFAAGMSVSIDECEAKISAHGYVHSDHPRVTYLGTMTVDIEFEQESSTEGKLSLTVHTPKDKIELAGTVTAGHVHMPSCILDG